MPGLPSVLITGGSGFVGRRLSQRLAECLPDHRRVSLQQNAGHTPPLGWEAESADVTDLAAVEQVIAKIAPDIVIHLAAQASVAQAREASEMTWGVNFIGSFAIARAVARHSPEATVLFASTAEIYGTSFKAGPVSESAPAAPQNPYATSKYAAERMFQDVLPQSAQLIIVRPFNHTGEGQDERFVLPSFAGQIARAELTPGCVRVGNLGVEREMLHVDDVVEAYVGLLSRRRELPGRTTVNVASGVGWKLGDLLDRMLAKATAPIPIEVDPARVRPVDLPRTVGDASLLRELTGWAPRRRIDELLDDVLRWARAKARTSAIDESG